MRHARHSNRTGRRCTAHRSRGISLIIALGTLAVFTLLVIGFASVVRSRRMAARAHTDDVQGRQLLYTALVRAIADASTTMAGTVYPVWFTNGVEGVIASTGTSNPCPSLVSGMAVEALPAALWPAATGVTASWVNVITPGGHTNGRVAWVVVNCSGLIDANMVGGETRTSNASVAELNLGAMPDVTGDPNTFYANRSAHRRYESTDELGRINPGLLKRHPDELFVYSYDPGRDAFYASLSDLGDPHSTFRNKFWVNGLPTVPGPPSYSAYDALPLFATNYFPSLCAIFAECGFPDANALAWNLVNYLDEDPVPQCDEPAPWLSSRVSEAIPLINELVLREVSGAPANTYELAVELWYPFFPESTAAGDFQLEVGAFTNALTGSDASAALSNAVLSGWSFRQPIGAMAYGSTSEFAVVTSPSPNRITFPDPTDPTVLLPIGSVVTWDEGSPPITRWRTNDVWFLARVTGPGMSSLVLDQAWGPDTVRLATTGAWSVDDPRSNGDASRWVAATESMGTTNPLCTAWADSAEGQGLPVFHRDGPLHAIGEIGNVYIPGTATSAWRNVDLLSPSGGALLDRMTVRQTNAPMHGLVAIGSSHTNVIALLFHGMQVGYSNAYTSTGYVLDTAAAEELASAIARSGPHQSYEDLQSRVLATAPGSIPDAFLTCAVTSAPPGTAVNDLLREAPFRNMLDLVTFRQNLFTIVLAAQALGRDGTTPVSEKNAVAVVFRDAYTGQSFVRSLRFLDE